MNTTSTNWVHDKIPLLSTNDKIRELLKEPSKLVLVQVHELERIKAQNKSKLSTNDYVNRLYDHYIVKGLPKTYIN